MEGGIPYRIWKGDNLFTLCLLRRCPSISQSVIKYLRGSSWELFIIERENKITNRTSQGIIMCQMRILQERILL